MNWVPLTGGIVDSSLWDEPDWVIKIFFTMLALKGKGDVYRGGAYALARASRKTEQEILDAWKILSGPDEKKLEAQPYNGARILAVEDGWFIINAATYRKKMSEELKRHRNARAQKAFRERKAGNNGKTLEQEMEDARDGKKSKWPKNSERQDIVPHEWQEQTGEINSDDPPF